MKLHPIVHDLKTTLWCGPGALATISGQPSSVCMQALRDSTWVNKPIKGITNTQLIKAAARLGFALTDVPMPPGPKVTLAAWTRENAAVFADSPVIVNVTGHYVTVKGRSFNDNQTKTPVLLKRASYRRARVQRAFKVARLPFSQAMPVPVVVARPPTNLIKQEAMQLASRHGILVGAEKGSDLIWVYAPPALDTDTLDRYAGDHGCYEWAEALCRVNEYVTDLNAAASAKVATL